jgi:hypothetical protein
MSEENLDIPASVNQEFIDLLRTGDFNKAKAHFDEIMSVKMNDRLDAEKAAVAATIFNSDDDLSIEDDDFFSDDDDDDQEEFDLDDEESEEEDV